MQVFDNYYGSSKRLITEKLKEAKILCSTLITRTRQIKNKKLN